MSLKFLAVIVIVASLCEPSRGHGGVVIPSTKKILVLPITMGDLGASHVKFCEEVSDILARDGHQVTILTDYSSAIKQDRHPNIRIVPPGLPPFMATHRDQLISNVQSSIEGAMTLNSLREGVQVDMKSCDDILGNETLMIELREEKFDIALVELLPSVCNQLIADSLGVRYAALVSAFMNMGEPHIFYRAFSIPYPLSYVPVAFMNSSKTELGFVDRLTNVAMYFMNQYFVDSMILGPYQELKLKYNINPHESIHDLIAKTELVFVNNFAGLAPPIPMPPTYIFIGGLGFHQSNPLPDEFEEFIEEAGDEGVFLLGFGSSITSLMNNKYADNLFYSLSVLEHRIIAPWKGKTPAFVGNNTKIWNWVPQTDILAHPKVRGVISHCGLNTMLESIYHAKPMICFPFWGDSMMTTKQCEKLGICRLLSLQYLTPQILRDDVAELISQPQYKANVVKLSSIIRERPVSGGDTLKYWIRVWMQNNGTQFLKDSGPSKLHWYQYYLIDVIGFVLITLCIIVFILSTVFRICCNRVKKLKMA